MAARRPLYYDTDGNFREMDSSDIINIQRKCVYMYGQDPSVILEVDSSAGNLNTMDDTRKTAGAAKESTGDGDGVTGDGGDFFSEAQTQEPQTVTVTYDQLKQTVTSDSAVADTNNKRFPVYYDGANIQAMTTTDMFDTFISPAIDLLVADSDMDGTFRIHTAATLADHTLISNKPVFTDTRANTALYSAGGIPEAVDQPFDVTTFYLYRTNQGAAFGDPNIRHTDNRLPLLIDADNNLKRTTDSDFSQILKQSMNYYTSSVAGSTIRYQVGGSGTTKGTVMTDTRLDGSGNYQTRIVGTAGSSATVYRSQEFPNGTAQVINSYTLKIRRE